VNLNPAHVHLLLNHLPMIILLVGIGQFAWAVWRNSVTLQKASLWIFVVSALVTIPTYLTGDGAEHVVESMPGVTEALIHAHEEPALYSLIGIVALGLLSASILWSKRQAKDWSGGVLYAALALSIVVVGLLGYTANQGGQIVHQEIRPAFQVVE
jgi:uncharacterized membrane protein